MINIENVPRSSLENTVQKSLPSSNFNIDCDPWSNGFWKLYFFFVKSVYEHRYLPQCLPYRKIHSLFPELLSLSLILFLNLKILVKMYYMKCFLLTYWAFLCHPDYSFSFFLFVIFPIVLFSLLWKWSGFLQMHVQIKSFFVFILVKKTSSLHL